MKVCFSIIPKIRGNQHGYLAEFEGMSVWAPSIDNIMLYFMAIELLLPYDTYFGVPGGNNVNSTGFVDYMALSN